MTGATVPAPVPAARLAPVRPPPLPAPATPGPGNAQRRPPRHAPAGLHLHAPAAMLRARCPTTVPGPCPLPATTAAAPATAGRSAARRRGARPSVVRRQFAACEPGCKRRRAAGSRYETPTTHPRPASWPGNKGGPRCLTTAPHVAQLDSAAVAQAPAAYAAPHPATPARRPAPVSHPAAGRTLQPAGLRPLGTGTPGASPGRACPAPKPQAARRQAARSGTAPGTHGNCRHGNCRARGAQPRSGHRANCGRSAPSSAARPR